MRPVFYAKVEQSDSVGGQTPHRHGKEQDKPQGLFTARKKMFVREVSGFFDNWRWVFVWLTQIVFYGTPWLQWNGRQAVLFDLNEHKFYLFGLVLWPSDVAYMAILLIICALALFLFTAVAGRLWCGYTCPQTVYTEIFMWFERKIEGDRVAQMRLDKAPLSFNKIWRKALKHSAWILVALWSGYTLVAYFTPVRELIVETLNFTLSAAEVFWIFFYGFMMYLFAGWMREQVCKYMCPYARFQSVMFDEDTLIVTYDVKRGESRGPRKKGIDPREVGKGDCIDCGVCVDVCPTGIDIRNGLQYECIGCGACIDGCNDIMAKMGYPKNLIRYDTENGVELGLSKKQLIRKVFRGRVLVYTAVLLALIGGLAYSLSERSVVKVRVERDARTVVRVLENGLIENVYRIQLSNSDEKAHQIALSAHGLNGISISGSNEILLPELSTQTLVLRLQVDPVKARSAGGTSGTNPVEIKLKTLDLKEEPMVEKTIFMLPKQD
ncbi:cytochrome c oxidase accessory protein CcoG [Hydromonas duriensis]|uniref:Cytochrome c oxidase accessory protein FixG n=1 Tax=Hydromonas duriensis TaxID=1527608 RepID=A0A4R6YBZ6_9BURK|nr:cytochrome c oxidase accessory protein CcoG [Hydromonas duriensis]TDR33134.1 cytochrome c oxidase accessory protein FixG [Hydromonas duriensis]